MVHSHSYRLQRFGGPIERVSRPLPILERSEVLLRVTHAGVCHSDVYIQEGYQDLGNSERMDFSHTTMPIPLVMGHEIVGEVVDVGSSGDRSLIGQRRLVYPWIGCGHCIACDGGQENHCETPRTLGIFADGGYAEHVVVAHPRYLLDIGRLDPAWACTLACSGLTVYSALKQLLPLKARGKIAVIGAGGLGLSAVSLARALGFSEIIVCDLSAERLSAALALGATDVLDSALPDVDHRLATLAEGRLCGVIDTVGLPATLMMSMGCVAKGARIVMVGLQGGRCALPLPMLPFKALSIIGSYTGSLSELHALIGLAQSGKLMPLPVHQRPLSCVEEALDILRSGGTVGRIVLNP